MDARVPRTIHISLCFGSRLALAITTFIGVFKVGLAIQSRLSSKELDELGCRPVIRSLPPVCPPAKQLCPSEARATASGAKFNGFQVIEMTQLLFIIEIRFESAYFEEEESWFR